MYKGILLLLFIFPLLLCAADIPFTVDNPGRIKGKRIIRAAIPFPRGQFRTADRFGVFRAKKQFPAQMTVLDRCTAIAPFHNGSHNVLHYDGHAAGIRWGILMGTQGLDSGNRFVSPEGAESFCYSQKCKNGKSSASNPDGCPRHES